MSLADRHRATLLGVSSQSREDSRRGHISTVLSIFTHTLWDFGPLPNLAQVQEGTYIHRSRSCARGIVSRWTSIITDHGDHNTCLSSLVDDILHILTIRVVYTTAALAVFVFGLI